MIPNWLVAGMVMAATAASQAVLPGAAAADPPVISVGDAAAYESDGTIVFDVTLSEPSAEFVNVGFKVQHLDTGDADFTSQLGGNLELFPGTTSGTIPFKLQNADPVEPPERFVLVLDDAKFAVVGDGVAEGTILDGSGPSIAILDTASPEGDSGEASSLVYDVVASYAPLEDLTVEVQTGQPDSDAEPGLDFLPVSEQITISAGSLGTIAEVPVLGDDVVETDEVVAVSLHDPSAGSLADPSAIGEIVDDDLPTVSVGDAVVLEGDHAVELAFTVSLDQPAHFPAVVHAAALPVTATTPDDWQAAATTVVFEPGVTERVVTVVVAGDDKAEATEALLLQLSDPSNAEIGDASAQGLLYDDDSASSSTGGGGAVGRDNAGDRGAGAARPVRAASLAYTGAQLALALLGVSLLVAGAAAALLGRWRLGNR